MKKFKLEHFIKDNPESVFPNYFSLDAGAATEIRRELAAKVNSNSQLADLSLVMTIDSLGQLCSGINAQNENFSLSKFLSRAGLNNIGDVFVNWYRYDDIDKFNLYELDKYFDYIWYPDADDIDIFDESLSWIVSISHTGQIKLLIINSN